MAKRSLTQTKPEELTAEYSRQFSWRYEVLKRSIDFLTSLVAIVLTGPIMILIAVLIKFDSPGPILFRQMRVGRDGVRFYMYKFRSMREDAEERLVELVNWNQASGFMFKMDTDPRITRVGKVIRRLSLDEMPQLFNVLLGNMSMVGPRPPLPSEVENYEPWHMERLKGMPGITGLWQVSRGDDIVFEEMVRMDIEYMDNWSIARDIMLMLKTVPAMLKGRGAF